MKIHHILLYHFHNLFIIFIICNNSTLTSKAIAVSCSESLQNPQKKLLEDEVEKPKTLLRSRLSPKISPKMNKILCSFQFIETTIPLVSKSCNSSMNLYIRLANPNVLISLVFTTTAQKILLCLIGAVGNDKYTT